jgi:hypothetical protein
MHAQQLTSDDEVEELFLRALTDLVTTRPLPFNISAISDRMKQLRHEWDIKRTHWGVFKTLADHMGDKVSINHQSQVTPPSPSSLPSPLLHYDALSLQHLMFTDS